MEIKITRIFDYPGTVDTPANHRRYDVIVVGGGCHVRFNHTLIAHNDAEERRALVQLHKYAARRFIAFRRALDAQRRAEARTKA